jgi:hypothetical protein
MSEIAKVSVEVITAIHRIASLRSRGIARISTVPKIGKKVTKVRIIDSIVIPQ